MYQVTHTLLSVTFGKAAVVAGLFFVSYTIYISVYRLFFHPLRQIPGPRLAALTFWVETYYECFKKPGGQFIFEYQKWHEKFGPIVRITPNEVHVQDPTFYDVLYATSRHSDKLKHLEHRFNHELSSFATSEHSIHRIRRGAINPFFSKRKIAQHSPSIQKHMDQLCNRVEQDFVASGKVLSLSNMWCAFTTDTVVDYSLEKPYNFITKPDFRAEFADALIDMVDPIHFITQFPWIPRMLKLLPDWLMKILAPPMAHVMEFNNEMKAQILRAKTVHATGEKKKGTETLFTSLLGSNLPPSELSTMRLQHEAIAVVGAGVETTSYTLSTCSYHLLANPRILAKLKAELASAIFGKTGSDDQEIHAIPKLDALMQLPYLTCVINEALRFSYGTTQRIPRLSPTPLIYSPSSSPYYSAVVTTKSNIGTNKSVRSNAPTPDDYVLPVGYPVSMDNYWTSHDPWLFSEPYEFRPERWEGSPRAPDGKPLTSYLVAFGRGTRSCVGMPLAYAELYIGLASFFSRFECDLFETGRDAVDLYLDSFVPRPKPGTQGVRVHVSKAE